MAAKAKARVIPTPDGWHSRWLQLGDRRTRLHRVKRFRPWPGRDPFFGPSGFWNVRGVTVCGIKGQLWMPGVVSRMGAQRCPACCKALGIPNGYGAPYNAFDDERKDA